MRATSPPRGSRNSKASLRKARRRNDKAAAAAAEAARAAEETRADAVKTADTIQENEEALSDLEQQLKSLDIDEKSKAEALDLRRQQMSGTITALARLAFRPTEALIGQPTSPADTVRSAILLREEVPRLRQAADQLRADLDAVAQVRLAIAEQKKKIAGTAGKLDADHKHLAALYAKRAEVRDQAEAQRHTTEVQLAALAGQAQDVRDLLAKIDSEKAAREAAQEAALRQAAQEAARKKEEQKQVLALNAPPPAPTPKPTPAPVVQPKPEPAPKSEAKPRPEAQLEAQPEAKPEARLEAPRAETPPPAPKEQPAAIVRPPELRSFTHAQGKMPFPARGHVVIHFGQAGEGGLPAKGITMETRAGAQVVTPYDGDVVFAGPFRGYGLLLIIEHGEGYHTLLAGMARIDSTVGQRLVAGEPVGVMDVSEDKPLLYVELRHSGQPINPLPWLMARKSKVGE